MYVLEKRSSLPDKVCSVLKKNNRSCNKIAILTDEDCNIKMCKIGFSWINLLLPIITSIIRKDYKNTVIQTIVCLLLGLISFRLVFVFWSLYSCVYNRIYIKSLLKKGYRPFNKAVEHMLKEEMLEV